MRRYPITCGSDRHELGIDDNGDICMLNHDIDEEYAHNEFGDASECYKAMNFITANPEAALVNCIGLKLLEMVRLCIDFGADVHYDNDYPLLCASMRDNLDVIKLLIEAGANVNAHKIVREIDPMIIAQISALKMAENRSTAEVVEYLKSVGAVT